MQVTEQRNITSNRPKYPMWYCKVTGRILKPKKPTKSSPRPGFKETPFVMDIPVKFDEDGETVLRTRSYCLVEKYGVSREDEIKFDKVEKLVSTGFTYIKD